MTSFNIVNLLDVKYLRNGSSCSSAAENNFFTQKTVENDPQIYCANSEKPMSDAKRKNFVDNRVRFAENGGKQQQNSSRQPLFKKECFDARKYGAISDVKVITNPPNLMNTTTAAETTAVGDANNKQQLETIRSPTLTELQMFFGLASKI